MMRLALLAVLLWPTLVTAGADNQLEGRWDTVRFALGIALTDNFDDRPVIIVDRVSDGGVVRFWNRDKLISYPVSDPTLETLISRLSEFFRGSELLLPNHQIRTVDHLEMMLAIDNGFSRMSYHRDIPMDDPEGVAKAFRDFIGEWTSKKPNRAVQ